ncbi:hypothetical protein ES703_40530 [subsurface metagenome]
MIKKIFLGMVPSLYRKEPGAMATILKWVLIGLTLRFIFMPITTHSDLISIYGRAFYMIEQNQFSGMAPLLAHYFHVLFLGEWHRNNIHSQYKFYVLIEVSGWILSFIPIYTEHFFS